MRYNYGSRYNSNALLYDKSGRVRRGFHTELIKVKKIHLKVKTQ